MKRIRLMLAAIFALGAVGGALAFKAKLPNPQVCIAPLTTNVCTKALTAGSAIGAGAGVNYTTTMNTVNCTNFTRCTKVGKPVAE